MRLLTFLICATIFLPLGCGAESVSSSVPQAFTPVPTDQLSAEERKAAEDISAAAHVMSWIAVRVDTGVLRDKRNETVSFRVAEDIKVTARRVSVSKSGERLTWTGELEGGSVALIVENQAALGTIRTSENQLYKARPLPGGLTIVTREDEGAYPPD